MASGLVNPWLLDGQSQTAAGLAILNAARADGTREFAGESRITTFDGAISGELWQLPAGPVAAAVGFDYRRESYKFDDGSRTVLPVFLAPFDPDFPKAERTVKAIYAEIAVPIVKGLETTFAVRHDDYSDFGGTTNPKVSIKWNPVQQFMFRGSYNEGFRAPSFFQLYTATTESQIPGNISDPVLCPQRPNDLSVCAIRPNSQQGGNPSLQPETSKQWSVGFLVEPTEWMSASVDLWQVHRYDHIYELTPQQVVANYTTFPENLVRGANGLLTDPGAYIRAGFVNAADDITKGVDVSLRFHGRVWEGRWTGTLDGTYIESYRGRVFATDPFVELAGQWSSRDIYPRWKHTATLGYESGPWSTTLMQRFVKGYKDQRPAAPPPGFDPDIDSYVTYDLLATYTGFKGFTLTFGVKNFLSEDPPFTAHNLDFTPGAGWDPRVTDPRGRSYVGRVTYRF
jgi:iron complex outermembrane receptor protein